MITNAEIDLLRLLGIPQHTIAMTQSVEISVNYDTPHPDQKNFGGQQIRVKLVLWSRESGRINIDFEIGSFASPYGGKPVLTRCNEWMQKVFAHDAD